MNKRKELWWFLIPCVLVNTIESIIHIANILHPEPELAQQQVYTLWDSGLWLKILDGLMSEWFLGAIWALVLGLALRWLPLPRVLKYVAIFVGAVLIQMIMCPSPLLGWTWSLIVMFLVVGNAAAFFAWLAECIWTAVKKPKQGAKQ